MQKKQQGAPAPTPVPVQKYKIYDLFGIVLTGTAPISPRTREFLLPYCDIVQDEGKVGVVKKSGPELKEATVKAFLARREQGDRRNSVPSAVAAVPARNSRSGSNANDSPKPPGK